MKKERRQAVLLLQTTLKVFNQAINDPSINTIKLSGTINLDSTTSIDRPVTITDGELSFSQSGQNLVLLNGGTLKNVTIRNTSESQVTIKRKTKSSDPVWSSTYGLQVYKGSATLDNCTFIGGNAGLLVNGSTVTLKGTTTISGTSFGGIEVSKGVNVGTAGILNIEGTLVNADEAYGKPTVWVDGTSEDIGKVIDTKGQLTQVVINEQNQYYLNPENSMKTWIDMSTYVSETSDGSYDGKDVALKIDGQSFSNESLATSQFQNSENPPKLHMTVTNCTFDGATEHGKQIYITNAQSLYLENCEFKNNSVSDYGVDVNLCTIQNSNIQIKNCKFESTGTKAALKISQRKGSTDHPDDITVTTPATISNVLLDGCSFTGNVRDYNIGTTPKGEDTEANTTTGAYPVTITGCTTDVVVAEPYLVGKDEEVPLTTIPSGETKSKTASGQFYAS